MRSVSQKSWSRCWAVDHEAHDQLDKSFNNPEGARSAKRTERVLATAAHSCKRKTPALPRLVEAQNDDVISANKRKLCSILDCVVN